MVIPKMKRGRWAEEQHGNTGLSCFYYPLIWLQSGKFLGYQDSIHKSRLFPEPGLTTLSYPPGRGSDCMSWKTWVSFEKCS